MKASPPTIETESLSSIAKGFSKTLPENLSMKFSPKHSGLMVVVALNVSIYFLAKNLES